MDFYIYANVSHGPQPMDPLVLYVFSVECSVVILRVSLNKSQAGH